MKAFYVYMMTNRSRVVLYTGITNSLMRRVSQHQDGEIEGFTKTYKVNRLVYYERFNDPRDAIAREKEIQLAGINQVNLNEKAGLNFATALRAFLRQDPDIIMVGEIRDLETADIAVKAAQTGHLVLSTLHTNDAVSTLVRLINIGVEPFLVASAVNVAAAQRLVRRICKDCKESYRPTADELALFAPDPGPEVLYRGRGCKNCRNVGYAGRMALYEVFGVDAEVRRMLIDGADGDKIQRYAIESGMVTLKQCGFRQAARGLTTLEEVLAVAADGD